MNCHFYYPIYFTHRYITAMLICFVINKPTTQVVVFMIMQFLTFAYSVAMRPFAFQFLNFIIIVGDLFCFLNSIFLLFYLQTGDYSDSKLTIHNWIFYSLLVMLYLLALFSLFHVLMTPF